MSYPFFPALTFAEFKAKLKSDFDCTVKKTSELFAQGVDSRTVTYFERTIAENTLQYSINDYSDETLVAPSILRSVCHRLKISTAGFGLDLG